MLFALLGAAVRHVHSCTGEVQDGGLEDYADLVPRDGKLAGVQPSHHPPVPATELPDGLLYHIPARFVVTTTT